MQPSTLSGRSKIEASAKHAPLVANTKEAAACDGRATVDGVYSSSPANRHPRKSVSKFDIRDDQWDILKQKS